MGDHVPFPARLRGDATGDHAWLAEVADELDELYDAVGQLQDRNEGQAKLIAAHVEVQVMYRRGFHFRWDIAGGHDFWEKPTGARVPAHQLVRVVMMQVADDVDRANREGVQ